MKRKILAISILAIGLLACNEKANSSEPTTIEDTENDEVTKNEAPEVVLEDVVKPVLFDYTSTGCPGCGSWGAPTFERIADEQKTSIVPIAVHIKYGDPMITDISNALGANRTGQRFTPQLFVNESNGVVLNAGRIDGNGSLLKLNEDLDGVKNREAQMYVGVTSTINESVMSLRYKTRAIDDLEGEYSVSVYIMEDKLFYNQSSAASNPFEHNYVIRAANDGAFGTALEQSNLKTGAESEFLIDMDLDENWKAENLYATVIVWKKEGNNYVVVNASNNKVY